MDTFANRLSEELICKDVELDNSRSGVVEIMVGADGKARRYVRESDHNAVLERVINAIGQQLKPDDRPN